MKFIWFSSRKITSENMFMHLQAAAGGAALSSVTQQKMLSSFSSFFQLGNHRNDYKKCTNAMIEYIKGYKAYTDRENDASKPNKSLLMSDTVTTPRHT